MTSTKILFWIALIIFLLCVGPFLTIWSLNALFPALAIPYTFDTWAAVVLLQVALRSNIESKK
jgi:hypothetical protein